MHEVDKFLAARQFLLDHREDYEAAYAGFRWPELERFNWATDWFDRYAEGNTRPALVIAEADGGTTTLGFDELARRSNQVANGFRRLGVGAGDPVLLMLDNVPALWEALLALMKLGAIVVPTTTLMTAEGIAFRVRHAGIRHVVTASEFASRCAAIEGLASRVAVGDPVAGWTRWDDVYAASAKTPPVPGTRADDPFLYYFTSGTTSQPKLVVHTHASYPVGHLSTLYWIGLRESDRHLNISSPGWAKHAWSSVFAPWNAGATVLALNTGRFEAPAVLERIVALEATTLCAPPTVWRLFIQQDLAAYRVSLTEVVGAGEPLNPEIIERVHRAWGLTLRDGYGQTETTAQIANPPGRDPMPGAMGVPMPGYRPTILDPDGAEVEEGELALQLDPRPLGLMQGYQGDPERTAQAMRDGVYRTGDVVRRDAEGRYWYVGRADDVFKSSDYRISPFELESVLIACDCVAEAAVVPAPDPVRLSVPKAYVVLREGYAADEATARDIFAFSRTCLAPYQRIRRLEFHELPKTISGKIRRVDLRRHAALGSDKEFREEEPG